MRLLLASAVFPPEPVVSARLSADLEQHLLQLGHDVTVLCPEPSRGGQNRKMLKAEMLKAETQKDETQKDEMLRAERRKDRAGSGEQGAGGDEMLKAEMRKAERGGVVRVDSYRCADSRLLGRARESWDFGRKTAGFLAQHQQTFDVVYMNAWPLFGPWEITRTARELGLPVVHHVQDVYPESLSTKLSPALFRLAAPPLLALDRRIVRRCAAVVLISQRMSQLYGRTRRMADRVRVVRNWVDATAFDAVHDRHTVCREYEVVPDRFTFLYLGNLSALSAVHSVIRAFARIPHAGKQLLIVGEGSTKAECQRLARELALPNILFRSEPDAGKVARIQTLADVCLMPTVRGGATASTPSKCISYMFSGKPILAAVDEQSDAADDIRQADCGWVCPPEDVEAIADAMQRAAALPADARAVLGRNARQFARQHFSRETGVTALADIILGAARTSAARA